MFKFISQVTATGLEPRTIQFVNEYSSICPKRIWSNLEQDFTSESTELFGALQKHRKITKTEINNFEKLRTLFLQNMLA